MQILLLLAICLSVAVAVPFYEQIRPANFRKGKADCACAPTALADDLSDPEVLKAAKVRIIKALWGSKVPVLNANGMKMASTVLTMSQSNSVEWLAKSWAMSTWSWTMLPYSAEDPPPTLCAYAQMITASLAWDRSKNAAAVASALDALLVANTQAIKNAGYIAAKSAECDVIPARVNPTAPSPACSEAYPLDDSWSLKSTRLPCIYETTTRVLAPSTFYADRLMATMATLSLSDIYQDYMNNYNSDILLEIMRLQNSGPVAKVCCCKDLLDRIAVLNTLHVAEMMRINNLLKKKYS